MLVTGCSASRRFTSWRSLECGAVTDRSQSVGNRVSWVAAFALAFVVEYVAVRHYFPGPVSAAGGVISTPWRCFSAGECCRLRRFARWDWRPCSRSPAGMSCTSTPRDWRRSFFLLNCYAFPAWIVFFYRMMSGQHHGIPAVVSRAPALHLRHRLWRPDDSCHHHQSGTY